MLAVERATDLGLHTIVAASSGGVTAWKFAKAVADTDIQLVIVTRVVGFSEPGEMYGSLMRQLTMNCGSTDTRLSAERMLFPVLNVHCPVPLSADRIISWCGQRSVSPKKLSQSAEPKMERIRFSLFAPPISHIASFFDLQVREEVPEVVVMPRNL